MQSNAFSRRFSRTLALGALLLAVIAMLQGCGGADARKARALERGHQYLSEENYPKARIEFNNALQIDPNNADALYFVGLATEKLNDLRSAAQAYQAAINVDAQHPAAVAALARLYVFSGLADRALDMVEKALVANPNHPDLLAIQAAAELALGRDEEAFDDASTVVRDHPEHEHAVALLAGIYRKRGEGTEAVALLERAVGEQPKSVDLRIVLAQLYVDVGANDKAEEQFKQVVALRPAEIDYRQRLVRFYAATNRPEAAEATLRELIQLDPKSTEYKLALVNYLTTQQSLDAAEKELLSMVGQSPDDEPLRIASGEFYEAHGLPADAERVYGEVIRRAGKAAPGLTARNRLAALMVRANRVPEAEPLIAEVLAANPRDNDALVLRGSIALSRNRALDAITDLRAVLRDQPDAPAVLRTLARAHVQNNEPDLARENYRHAVEKDPANVDARVEYADFLSKRGDYDESRRIVETVLASQPTNLPALEIQVRVLSAKGEKDAALAAATAMVGYYPEQALGYYLRGALEEGAGDKSAALASYETALAKQPRGAEPLGALARVLVTTGKRAEARQRLEHVVADMPDNAVALNLLAELLVSDKQNDQAIARTEAAIGLAPTWWIPYRTKALAQLSAGDVPAAQSTYEQGMKVTGSPALGVDLAALYERSQKTEQAIAVYETLQQANPASEPLANNLAMLLTTYRDDTASHERAHELVRDFRNSDNPAYLNTYGWVSYRQGRLDEAVTYLRRAVVAQPESAIMRYHLGMALLGSGDTDKARVELEAAVKSDQGFPGKDAAAAALQKLVGARG